MIYNPKKDWLKKAIEVQRRRYASGKRGVAKAVRRCFRRTAMEFKGVVGYEYRTLIGKLEVRW